MSEKPISLKKIRDFVDPDMPLRVAHESINRLQNEYEQKHHGLRLCEVAEGYQFRTKATYSKYVQDIFKVNSMLLGPTALEVLAIIAYKQPVTKIEVDKIRGVDSSHIVRTLMDRRLVKVVGRAEDVGRPTLFGTTAEFLEVFNLGQIADLPSEHELESMAETNVGQISDIRGLVNAGDKKAFNFDEWAELDELSENIKLITSETEFTKSLESEDKRRQNSSESEPIRSAFELLEEYVQRNQSRNQNLEASSSEPFVVGDIPQVISDLEAGPFNLPSAEEEFQMIDLDTGEAIESEEDEIDIFAQDIDLEDQRHNLQEVLDQALNERFKEELEALTDELNLEKELDDKFATFMQQSHLDSTVEKAKELGIDIDFLGEGLPDLPLELDEGEELENREDSDE